MSASGFIAYLVGTSLNDEKKAIPTIWACEFNRSFERKAKAFIGVESDKTPVVVKRIPSYEILVIGCLKNLILMEYNPSTQQIVTLAKVPNLHTGFIVDIAIRGEKIYTKCDKEKYVKATEFGPRMTHSILMNPALTSALQSQLHSPRSSTSQLPASFLDEKVRYRQSQFSRIPVSTQHALEKIAISKTAKVIYAGGSQGISMFKFNDQFQQYQYVQNMVI